MNDLTLTNNNLPSNIEDLSQYVLLNRQKLAVVEEEVKRIKRVDTAKGVYEQKLKEAQQIAEMVTLAEVQVGKLLLNMPRVPNNQFTKNASSPAGEEAKTELVQPKTKTEITKELGFTPKRVEQLQTMAKHDEVVKKAIAEAKANDDIVSRSLVLNMIKQEQKEAKKDAIKTSIENYAKVQTGIVDIYHTNKKYNIIYADPPWRYWEGGDKNQSKHYLTMPIEDICKIPVSNIADENCVLFLWVTYPILPDVFRVIESWGFDYSTCGFCWVKRNKQADSPFFGCGAWTRANSELCLIATKGSVMRLDATISQVIESPIEEHSKKPDIVRELITKLVGELPRIELFSRQQVDGWDVWGNEA